MSLAERDKIINEINPLPHQKIFFTSIKYGVPYHIISKEEKTITTNDEVLLVCGIANPLPLKTYLTENAKTYHQMLFTDHHIFTIDDLNKISEQFKEIDVKQKIILTTEKDAVRLVKFQQELKPIPLYVLPIKVNFLFDEAKHFDTAVANFINEFKLKNR
jgi:tetraacyldisaccharide 4'-kinase